VETEKTTRRQIIDQRLKDAGWSVADPSQVIQEFFISSPVDQSSAGLILHDEPASDDSHEFSDYALLGKNGKPIAVVESKKSSKDAELGREQCKQYCYNIQKKDGGELPFCFYTNGHDIFFWNLGEAPPKKVHGFPTRQDLERLLHIRKHKVALTDELINTAIAGRDYQLAQRLIQ
jgi:type I restriction enzyme R subunit